MKGEKLRKLLRTLTGLSIYKKHPLGVDCLEDLIYYLGKTDFKVFFDIGANHGQTTQSILKRFPKASVYCFEPIETTFLELKNALSGTRCFCMNIGIGDEDKYVSFANASEEGDSTMWTRVSDTQNTENVKKIQIQKLDTFCKEKNIDSIDYLKTDTEGHEIEVLEGATYLLKQGKIKVLNIEVGMNFKNTYHNSFAEIQKIMESYGYILFGIYDQVHEWKLEKPYLRVSNCVFINSNIF